jgi:hypothetical protein
VKRQAWIEACVFAGLVLAGAGARIWFRELPNFAPIAAMALFAGYFFRTRGVAVLVPLAAMLLSDAVIGGYEWQIMLVVYGMLALPVVFGGLLKQWLRIEPGRLSGTLASAGGLFGLSLLSSVLFFLATNLACWLWSEIYDTTWPDLVRCYANALPFFRHTLLGDTVFASALFGGYALAVHCGWLVAAGYQLPSRPSVMPCAQKSV